MNKSNEQMRDTTITRRAVVMVTTATGIALAVTILIWVLLNQSSNGDTPLRDLFILTKVFVSIFTATILIGLVVTYLRLYRELPNPFTRTLLLINISLLLYAIWANPIVWVIFGVEPTGIGLFTVLPDVFTAVAAIMLLQQSEK